jgi:serine phosphatase RsbU (regulator of sigma subunit)
VGALRNARRAGATLVQQARTGSAALFDYIGDGSFVTGQLVRIDLRTETATAVNAGHPLPLRMRDGAVEEILLEADPPFGTVPGHAYRTQALAFEPGDRVLFFTDGIIDGAPGAVDLAAHMLATAHLHPREAVQELVRVVRAAAGGPLRDDATAMCVDWHGGGSQPRSSDGGADGAAASSV